MIRINAHTRIGDIIRQHPAALEAIVAISPVFTKLRNPVLRKLMAGRTSISMACKMGGCSTADFRKQLQPLGFEMEHTGEVAVAAAETKAVPAFMKTLGTNHLIALDVRPIISAGDDPLKIIMEQIKSMKPGTVLSIVNSFVPTPLINLLNKQGFESFTESKDSETVNTYFYKNDQCISPARPDDFAETGDWEEILQKFENSFETVDVRHMEMPLPMHTIVDALNVLPEEKALFVYHKRIPVFLLPELEERGFNFRVKEIGPSEVHLLIYKK